MYTRTVILTRKATVSRGDHKTKSFLVENTSHLRYLGSLSIVDIKNRCLLLSLKLTVTVHYVIIC
jgi:hypothetical protein